MKRKKCSKCGKRKPITEFNRHAQTRDRLRPECKKCFGEASRAYREARSDIRREQRMARQEDNRRLILTAKGDRCQRCSGRFPPYVLEFHHRDPREKSFNITPSRHMAARVLQEIAKCDVLCANCHRTVEWEEGRRGASDS